MMKQFQMFGKQPDPIQHIIGELVNYLSSVWVVEDAEESWEARSPLCIAGNAFSWHVAGESLHWDSFEQFCVWQLISAESPDCQLVIPALANLNPEGTSIYE